MSDHEENVDALLDAARGRLEAFQDAVTSERLLRRLEHETAAHPLLLAYKFLIGLMAACVALALVVLAAPLVSMDWARTLALAELRIRMPLPFALLILAFCTAVLGLAFRHLAVLRGGRSPLLPHEMKEHQALASEVARLSSRKRLQERGFNSD